MKRDASGCGGMVVEIMDLVPWQLRVVAAAWCHGSSPSASQPDLLRVSSYSRTQAEGAASICTCHFTVRTGGERGDAMPPL